MTDCDKNGIKNEMINDLVKLVQNKQFVNTIGNKTLVELRDVCRNLAIKISGNKAEVQHRILDNVKQNIYLP